MKVVIVGGGIAGLAAGIYARQSGMEATILEMHSIPGGNCTSWKRGGYYFEGGMHWLVGSGKDSPMRKVWEELGAIAADTPIYDRDPFLTYTDGGQEICLYRDPGKLEEHLLAVSPQDRRAIRRLAKDIRAMGGMVMPVMDIKGVRVKYPSKPPISMLGALFRAMPRMNALGKITAGEYADRFEHPGIRELLKTVVGDTAYTATSTLFTLGGLSTGDGGYPAGGSIRMARNMAGRFIALGGEILYNTRVSHVHVRDGKAAGLYAGDALFEADAVLVTADTLAAMDGLFETPFEEPWTEELRREAKPLLCTFVGMGVKADLSALPENVLLPLNNPVRFAGQAYAHLMLNNYANFQAYAPENCTALTCVLVGDTYDFWKAAKEDGSYAGKKRELADTLISALAEAVPQAAGKVEIVDVATPLTYERYCGTYRGSWMSVMSPGLSRQQYPQKAESVRDLYFAGQRLMLPGGLPVAASTGRMAVQHICLDRGLVFQGEML